MRSTLLVAGLVFVAASAHASSPSLTAVRPVGAQRGTEVEVTLSGARLGDAQEILWYQPGIETLGITKVDDNVVKAKLRIAPDCAMGIHDLRVRTATGVSDHRTFSVGPYPVVDEVEPNNDFAKPQPITLGATVHGVADNEDVDFYVVQAKKGQRIAAEVEGIRTGISIFDPYVAIMDAKRFELASSDDAALTWQDGYASVVAPEDGPYVVQVRESAYAGNGGCLYRLHVGDFPRPNAIVPAGGMPGEKVAVRWIGDVLGERTTEVVLPSNPSDPNAGIYAQDEHGTAPYPSLIRLSPFGNVVEKEPNDDHAAATPFTPPMALNGVIDKEKDADYYTFSAKKGQVYDFSVFGRRLRSPLDPVMHVARRNGAYTVGVDDGIGPDGTFRLAVPEDGEYVVWVHDHLQKGGPEYAYRVEVTIPTASLAMSVPNEGLGRGTGVIASAIPRGNRQAILVNAARKDFGGDLVLGAENLPPGVELQADAMAANLGTFPILLVAAPDAPRGWEAREDHRQARGFERRHRTLRVHPGRRARNRPEPDPVLDPDRGLVRGGRDRGVPLHDRDRPAEGPDRPRRVDGPEGPGHAQGGVHRPDRDQPTLEPAGHQLAGGRGHPRGADRGRHPTERRRRGGAEDLEDRGQRRVGRGQRADHGLDAARRPRGGRSIRRADLPERGG